MYLLAHALVRLYRKSPEYSFATSGRPKWVNTKITETEISVRVTEPKQSLLYFQIYQQGLSVFSSQVIANNVAPIRKVGQ